MGQPYKVSGMGLTVHCAGARQQGKLDGAAQRVRPRTRAIRGWR